MNNSKGDSMSHAAQQVRSGVAEFKDAAVSSAADAMDVAKEKLQGAHAHGEKVIKGNPYTSVLVAFGVGAILGVIMARR